MLTVKWNIYSRFALTSEGEETEVCFGSDANEFFCLRSVCYPVPSGVYLWDRDRQVPPYRHSRHWGQSRNWQRQRTLWRNYGLPQHLRQIHAVVVLLKPNNARLTVALRFCVLELLRHLHKSLQSNITFAFNNSRGTFYEPGDTLPVLKEFLEENNLKIDVSPSNYFCFDNEAFRYLSFKGLNFIPENIGFF